ncbi:amidase [Shumkonia mesophila]|uniref:amidase n=1 Tax=Shumkonia mesophila TaxID=2838854 RepID=UPI002934516E|nr:amidase [Shumkonia mesophila]
MSEPFYLSVATLGAAFRAGELDPVAVTEAFLERIQHLNPTLKCFKAITEGAVAAAEASRMRHRSGTPLGPLDGVPVAVKDNYFTRDLPTTAGTTAPGISFPMVDSTPVGRLRAAGAVILGKTVTHEFAWGTVTPPVANPWDTARVPGGSSGGSASALAAGLCAAALGSDTGGSVRIPASLCGVVGLKATFGAISRHGIVPHSWSLDHPGPLTRTVEDAALMFDVMAGPDERDPATLLAADAPDGGTAKPLAELTIGVCRRHFFDHVEPDVLEAVEAAIQFYQARGARVREFDLPLLDYGLGAIFAIELASSTAYHDVSLRAGKVASFTPDVRDLVEMGRWVAAPDYLKAEQYRTALIEGFRAAMEQVDLIVTPTEPLVAWPIGEWTARIGGEDESVLAASWRLTYPFNLTGMPAISLPCGFDRNDLPIGLQIAGRPFEEACVLGAAAAYESAHPWAGRRPPL